MNNQNKTYRYQGTRPFTKTDEDLFFGRDTDIEKLSQFIMLEKQVVLYGKSGLGKTSLLNAGVIPKLEREKYLVTTVRFGSHTPEKDYSPTDILRQNLMANLTYDNFLWTKLLQFSPDNFDKVSNFVKVAETLENLWYYCKSIQIQKPGQQAFLIVFDQFEELFTYPDKEVVRFKQAFSELLNIRVPQYVRTLIKEKGKDFLSRVETQLLYRSLNIKVVFSIRSDKMSFLNRLKDFFPEILQKTYELEPLSIEQAESAIIKPAQAGKQIFISPVFKYSDNVLSTILDFLSKQNEQKIEAFQLQIVCQYIENIIIESKVKVVTREHLGNIEAIYKNFYEKLIGKVPENEQNKAKNFIEEGLIFEEDQRRLSLYEGQVLKTYKITKEVLQQLVNTHLLRTEPNPSGGFSYELSHDSLVAPILKARKQRIAKEEKARAEVERQEELRRLQEEKEREERERQKVQVEKDRADKLLEKSQQLLRYLVPKNTPLIYKYFADKAAEELEYCRFEPAARYYLFAWLAFDLPDSLDADMKQKAETANQLAVLNANATEHYRNFRYKKAETGYRKILDHLPNNEIILKRIKYCQHPVFTKDNFVLIKGGTYTMGDSSYANNPKHKVTLTDFYLCKYETTNAEFAEFLNIYGSDRIKQGEYNDEYMLDFDRLGIQKEGKIWKQVSEQYANHPVVRVSWFGANEFCKFWNTQLPTEAQWEFAARSGGKNYKYSWGNDEPHGKNTKKFGNIADITLNRERPQFTDFEKEYDDGYAITSPVGSFEPNELNLFDMSGNVWEWCKDWYDDNFYKNSEGETNPVNLKTATSRVERGGSWRHPAVISQSAYRNCFDAPGFRDYFVGFRPCFVQ